MGKLTSLSMQIDSSSLNNENGLKLKLTARTDGDVKRLLPPDLGISSNTRMKVKLLEEKEVETPKVEIHSHRIFDYTIYPNSKELELQPILKYFNTASKIRCWKSRRSNDTSFKKRGRRTNLWPC